MNRDIVSALAIVLFTAIVCAQVAPQPAVVPNSPAQAPPANGLAPGTILSVELSKALDAKKLKANDKFEARTAIDLLSHGQIVIPRNTRIIGHVTEAKAHSRQSPGALVGITFDRALMKDGRELPLKAAVQAIARPPSDPANATSSTVSPLGPTSKGVVGIKGLSLDSSGPASVISSKTDNVRLDGGTQLILRVQ